MFFTIKPVCFVSLAFAIASIGSIAAGQDPTASDGPNWGRQIVESPEFDFGDVPLGSEVKHFFELKNTTDQPIRIQSVASSCGCTVTKLHRAEIPVGATEKLQISLDTLRFRGLKKSTILVRFAEPADHEIQLLVSVNIRNLHVEPETVEFTNVEIAKLASRTLLISRGGSPFWKINSVASSNPTLTPKILGRTIKGNLVTYEIECTLIENAPAIRQEQITIQTNDTNELEFFVPVSIEIVDPIAVSQQVIEFGDAPRETMKTFIVKTLEPSEIVGLSMDTRAFSATEPKAGRKNSHFIQVTRLTDGGEKVELKILTDQSKEPVIVKIQSGAIKNE